MNIKSPEFGHHDMIPSKFTCQGDDINPALVIDDYPKETKSLVLICDDPDAPGGTWDHWLLYDINPGRSGKVTIEEDSAPGTEGKNSWGRNDYGGPCPPSGTHRYFFKVYALDASLNLDAGIEKSRLENAMEGRILDENELIGLYKKS